MQYETRYDIEGVPGLETRPSLPKVSPSRMSEMLACEGRVRARRGAEQLEVARDAAANSEVARAGAAMHDQHHRNVVAIESVRRGRK